MKLTTKRYRWYFFRELFTYMIPMILIVWTIDVFVSFIRCWSHPEWSAPCSINWILAIIYLIFLLITIILAILSNKKLRKVKKKIENEFMRSINEERIEESFNSWINEENIKWETKILDDVQWDLKDKRKKKKIIVKWHSTLKEKNETDKTAKKRTWTKKSSVKKNVTKK